MKEKSWSVAKRMQRWFALVSAGLVLVVAGISALHLRDSLRRELAAFAEEELEEMAVHFSVSDGTTSDFERIAGELETRHAGAGLAWKVWRPGSGELWGEYGSPEMLALVSPPPRGRLGRLTELDGGFVWKTRELAPGVVVGVLIDPFVQVAFMRRYWVSMGVAALVAMAFGLLAGRFLGGRLGTMLANVAESARSISNPDQDGRLRFEGTPEEIRGVAEGLQAMLGNIRREFGRVNLLTAGLAHELRSPIQNLMGETQVALLREREPVEYRRVLESHLEELRDLAGVVDNLVTLCAQGGGSKTSQRMEEFDLGDEVRLRLKREFQVAARAGIDLVLDIAGDLTIQGDREALLLAVRNLVTNAIKWSPRQGVVHVRLEGEDDRIVVRVDDGGPGIGKEEWDKIFEPFYQGGARGERMGYGLGLALTKTAVESRGGRIRLGNSTLGGAGFTIELPRKTGADHARGRPELGATAPRV